MYKVLADFADMQDNGYIYRTGDYFPRAGYEPEADRLAELQSNSNRIGTPLIGPAGEPESGVETEPPKKRSRKKPAEADPKAVG